VLVGFRDSMSLPYNTLFAVERAHMGPLAVGVFLTARAGGAIAMSMLFGAWFDRRPSLWPLMVTLAAGSVGYALLTTTNDFAALCLIAIVPLGMGAAAFPLVSGRRKRDGSYSLPVAAIVSNFSPPSTHRPSLLTHSEVRTLFHEFGHIMHQTLTRAPYASLSGSSVPQDFVEAPSQMLEDWVYDTKVLALFKEVCPTCKPAPADLVARATQARDFAKGILFARQHLYASYDLALYTKDAPEPMETWARMEGATPLGHVKGSMFPAGFSHIATGYASGYYGYLWSLVLAEDLRTAFAADKLSSEVGLRYREQVLSQGGQVAPAQLMRNFLGRDTNSDAFFKSLNRHND
jgi:Zn-dependent oligopeptidase